MVIKMAAADLDLITLGRSSVDLYGEQVGGRLEDMGSFAKYVGGSPTNTAVGAARLGLQAALLTRVGADHMGRFIREQLVREGVDVALGGHRSEARLTALVILGIRDREQLPADLLPRELRRHGARRGRRRRGLRSRSARAVLINGTHLSQAARVRGQPAGRRRWPGGGRQGGVRHRLPPGALGPDRAATWARTASSPTQAVTARSCSRSLPALRPDRRHRGGDPHPRRRRPTRSRRCGRSRAHRRAAGLQARAAGLRRLPGRDPATASTTASSGRASTVEVFNVLGAGDAFMSGFLRGWLRDEPLERCCELANACGRHRGLAPRLRARPCRPGRRWRRSWPARPRPFRLREDAELEHIHWATTRGRTYDRADRAGHRPPQPVRGPGRRTGRRRGPRRRPSRRWRCRRCDAVAGGDPRLRHPARRPLRLRRPGRGRGPSLLDRPAASRSRARGRSSSRARADVATELARVAAEPGGQVPGASITRTTSRSCASARNASCSACSTPAARPATSCCSRSSPPPARPVDATTIARAHRAGSTISASKPDWWKLEPMDDPAAWRDIAGGDRRAAIRICRGVVLLGLSQPTETLVAAFEATARRADRQGLRGRPHHLRTSRRAPGWPARSTTPRRSRQLADRLLAPGRGLARAPAPAVGQAA